MNAFFGVCGAVVNAAVLKTNTGRSMGSGTVEFASSEAALLAVSQLSNQPFKGRNIIVREYFRS